MMRKVSALPERHLPICDGAISLYINGSLMPGNVIYPGEGYEEEENDDDYYEDEALEETGGKKKAKKAKKLLRKLNVGKIGKHIGRCPVIIV